MIRWTVWTPDYERYCANAIDPAEYGADVIVVEAATNREAIIFGVRFMLKDWSYRYCRIKQSDNECPFTGLRAEPYYQ